MIQNGGSSPGIAAGSVTTTSSLNQDVSSPLLIDYLKTRCYLYKFTPNILPGGSVALPLPVQTSVSSTLQQRLTSMQTVVDQLINIYLKVSQVNLPLLFGQQAIPGQAAFLATLASATYVNASAALIFLINLPHLQDGNSGAIAYLTITDSGISIPFTNASGASLYPEVTSGSPVGFLGRNAALYEFIRSGNQTGVAQSTLQIYLADLLTWLTNTWGTINQAISSIAPAQAQLAASSASSTVALKQFQVSRFAYDLNVGDLSRFDLSQFISSYSADQRVGDIAAVGTMSGSAVFQDAVIALQDLGPVVGLAGVRRPIFFPDENGDYAGYTNGLPNSALGPSFVPAVNPTVIPSLDPASLESVSTLQANDLITRIAMAQTLEDNGGSNTTPGYDSEFFADVDRVEIAMRLRGISNSRKRELILKYFSTGSVDPELIRLVAGATQPNLSTQVATGALVTATAVSNLLTNSNASPGLTASQQAIANNLTAKPGDTSRQRGELEAYLTDAKVDGIMLSDLIQKYDFFSIFIYKHEISPDTVETTLISNTGDPYFFDKESLLLATPFTFYLNAYPPAKGTTIASDSRVFATYASEFNGFIAETSNSSTPGSVNTLNINLTGSMGLMGATKRVYNSTIFQQSVFDAAETFDFSSTFSLFQNLYAHKNPLQILTILLDSLYFLRVALPQQASAVGISDAEAAAIRTSIQNQAPVGQSADITGMQTNAAIATAKRLAKATTIGGSTVRDTLGNIASFLDILSLRAFNQFGVTGIDSTTGNTVLLGSMNLFNMAAFLYANVMRQRRFNVRVATTDQIDQLDQKYGGRGSGTKKFPYLLKQQGGGSNDIGAFQPFDSSSGLLVKRPKDCDGSGGSILEINPFLDTAGAAANKTLAALPDITAQALAWKTYYIFLSSSFDNFVADLKTPFEIMGDVVSSCYLELFETPGGRFIFRTPQYNNDIPLYRLSSQDGSVTTTAQPTLVTNQNNTTTLSTTASESSNYAHMITSQDIIVISTQYNQTVKNLVSKQAIAYGADLLGAAIIPQLYYFYSNGKMVAQYGLSMGRAIENPNVRAIPRDKLISAVDNSTIFEGIFHYCRFFLEYSNMNNFVATITAVADPVIQAGRTYFDIKNQKFGYVTHVTKNLDVGGTYTCTFTLNAVRDAVYGIIPSNTGTPTVGQPLAVPIFRHLPEMEEFIGKFTSGNVSIKNISPNPPLAAGIPSQVFQLYPGSFFLDSTSAAGGFAPNIRTNQ